MEQPGEDRYKIELGYTDAEDAAKVDYVNLILMKKGMYRFIREEVNDGEQGHIAD